MKEKKQTYEQEKEIKNEKENMAENGDGDGLGVTLAYRHLYYDQKDDKLIQDMRFSGPALGVTFRF